MAVRTRTSALAELADLIRAADRPLQTNWLTVHNRFADWTRRTAMRDELRQHLRSLDGTGTEGVLTNSRETTTHFAWCLLNRPEDEFSIWLHEYKPQVDWRPGYADSVHNHRYHFCTTILRGGYRHQRFAADLNPVTGLIRDVRLLRSTDCGPTTTGYLLAEEFHRIPAAVDSTMTLLVKSRPLRDHSLSFDPATNTGHRHIPVENRLDELTARI